MSVKEVDVIVVGGGISGLTAARRLLQKDPSLHVLVLEAKDRVGGRTETVTLKSADGTDCWDVGGQWVGRSQPHILALLEELQIDTHPQYHEGTKFMQLGDHKIRSYESDIPSLSLMGLIDIHRLLTKLEKMSKEVDPASPYSCPKASEWDSMTTETFARRQCWTQGAYDALVAANRCMFGAEGSQISLLYTLMYASASGGMKNLLESTEYTNQEYRIKGGAQQVSKKMAQELGSERVLLGYPVAGIKQTNDGVTVSTTNNKVFTCQKVILATPPPQTSQIMFEPALPTERVEINKRMPFSNLIKVLITYKEAFWRNAKQSGEVVTNGGPSTTKECEAGPLCIVYDATSSTGSPALVGFIGGRQAVQWRQQEFEHRRSAVLKSLSDFFGNGVYNFLDYREKDWFQEPYTGGSPVCCVAPGAMEYFANGLRQPFGRLHFAGTESATMSCGFMSGAVQAGQRAAVEVLYDLRPQLITAPDLIDPFEPRRSLVPKKERSKIYHVAKWTVILGLVAGTVVVVRKTWFSSS